MPPKPKREEQAATPSSEKPEEAGKLSFAPSRPLDPSRLKWKRKEQAATPQKPEEAGKLSLAPSRPLDPSRLKWRRKEQAATPHSQQPQQPAELSLDPSSASVSSASGSSNVSGARSSNSDVLSGGSSSHAGRSESSSTTAQSKRKKPQLDRPNGIKLPKSMKSEMPIEDLKSTFRQFLRSSEGYKSQLLNDPVLAIDFNHLLYENKRLAMTICNEDMKWKNPWMTTVLREFALEVGSSSGSVNIHFINKPDRIFLAADLLGSPHQMTTVVTVFKEKKADILTTTPRARILFLVIIWGILDRLEKGDSWAGSLKLEDLFFIDLAGQLHLLILKEPVAKGNASPQEQALDVNGIWSFIEPFVLMANGSLPLFFEQLKHDLISATSTEVQQGWFFEYLRYSAGLAPSMARKNLLVDLYDSTVSFRLSKNPRFKGLKDLFESKPRPASDWRDDVATDEVLAPIYMHKLNELRRKLTFTKPHEVVVCEHEKLKVEEHEPDDMDGLIFNYPAVVTVQRLPPLGPKEEKLEVDPEEGKNTVEKPEEVVRIEDFRDTTKSCLAFNRHSLTHTADNVRPSDPDDVELYGAKALPDFLPFVVKELLRICKMRSKFRRAWDAYPACVRGQKDTAEGVDH